ncbi:MAG: nickel-dependent lactate racemase [Sporomusaceae bacterium]|nr:nickel-dependent lactate racemase [Sporomusaceae bacterium]
MSTKVVEFGYGKGTITFNLPEAQIIEEIDGRPATAISDVPAAVRHALNHPIGTPPLRQIVKAGDKTVIVVSDITRAWIKHDQFLPTLLDELNAAGIPDGDIAIVVALGAHRQHTPEEDVLVCGKAVCDRVPVYQHDAFNEENLVYVGTTSGGTASYINKRVAEADRVIFTGGIVYHLMAGFGGGRKSAMPGISGYKSIQANHTFCLHQQVGKGLNPNCGSGSLETNEMHKDCSEIMAFVKPDFLLNAVFTPEGKFAKFVAGHWYEAWLEGTREVERIFGIPVAEQADLVVASAGGFPKDINLYQGSKTIDNAYLATKPGGVAICCLECPDIYEPPEFSDWFKHPTLLDHELALRAGFTVPGYVAFKCANIAREISLIIVTKPENCDFIRNAGMIPASSAEEALAIAREKLGRDDYTITVMGHAANTVPIVRK